MLEILRLRLTLDPELLKRLPENRIPQSPDVFNVLAGMGGFEEVGDGAALGGDGFFADFGGVAFGDAVEAFAEVVFGVVADFLCAAGVFVVEGFFGAEGFEEGVVVCGGCCDYAAARAEGCQ